MRSIKKIPANVNLDQDMLKMYLNQIIEEVDTLQQMIGLHADIMHDNGLQNNYEDSYE